jgi:aspartate aminotransferase
MICFNADEVYREFTYDGDIHYSVMNIPGLEETQS